MHHFDDDDDDDGGDDDYGEDDDGKWTCSIVAKTNRTAPETNRTNTENTNL